MNDWTIMVYIAADNLLSNFAIDSLKQLRDAAGKTKGGDNVVVIAELADTQSKNGRLFRFDGNPEKRTASIRDSENTHATKDSSIRSIRNIKMTDSKTLTEFINYACSRSKTEHYCLIIWGHGIELLLDEDRRFVSARELARLAKKGLSVAYREPVARYLKIGKLKEALKNTNLVQKKLKHNSKAHLDIIGFDSCSMSMIEVATELSGCADFMIASQQDVPDESFPYRDILSKLREHKSGGNAKEICEFVPKLYQATFEDYIMAPETGVSEITLASLNLSKIDRLPIASLADALLSASSNELADYVFSARQKAQDFVSGILVDLYDFCSCLIEKIDKSNKKVRLQGASLRSACEEIRKQIDPGQDVNNPIDSDKIVVAQTPSNRCHGLSIYFPYNKPDPTDDAQVQYAKGGGRQPSKERLARIRDLEKEFGELKEFPPEWMQFIREGWTAILAEKRKFQLDQVYSAEQAAQNLFHTLREKRRAGPQLVRSRRGRETNEDASGRSGRRKDAA